MIHNRSVDVNRNVVRDGSVIRITVESEKVDEVGEYEPSGYDFARPQRL